MGFDNKKKKSVPVSGIENGQNMKNGHSSTYSDILIDFSIYAALHVLRHTTVHFFFQNVNTGLPHSCPMKARYEVSVMNWKYNLPFELTRCLNITLWLIGL